MKKNKNKKINSIILKSFIAVAVVMMLISVMPSEERKVSGTTITCEESGKWSKTN